MKEREFDGGKLVFSNENDSLKASEASLETNLPKVSPTEQVEKDEFEFTEDNLKPSIELVKGKNETEEANMLNASIFPDPYKVKHLLINFNKGVVWMCIFRPVIFPLQFQLVIISFIKCLGSYYFT